MDTKQLFTTAFESVMQGQIPSPEILKPLISKLLGYGLLAGSCVVKVPQISNVVGSGSADGLSPLAFELETVVYIISAGYGYVKQLDFSAYGESAILALENLFLLALIYRYAKISMTRSAFVLGLLVGAAVAIFMGQFDLATMTSLYELNNIIQLSARLPQIYKNFTEKNTGQLSLATNGINVIGGAARIFTTFQEGGGPAMLRSYLLAITLNLTVVIQILMYKNKAPKGSARSAKARAAAIKARAKKD